ncbi:Hypothetical protein CINCED_3A005483 [Cinara cedri]|uniref:Uncharacterized protein n=1 Tax=Cinara cedri TaxID=506608 RepID=A0A5E4N4H9_9HEMI|nr:Hypothetical protein CINCED_3A005483 [Cinara cedri]
MDRNFKKKNICHTMRVFEYLTFSVLLFSMAMRISAFGQYDKMLNWLSGKAIEAAEVSLTTAIRMVNAETSAEVAQLTMEAGTATARLARVTIRVATKMPIRNDGLVTKLIVPASNIPISSFLIKSSVHFIIPTTHSHRHNK